MRLLTICGAAAWLTCGALACSGNQVTPGDPSQRAANDKVPAMRGSDVDRETTVQISDDIRTECRLTQSSADPPRFELDQSTLRGPEKSSLDEVANCLKDGPLQNRTVTIVGRTDPRGDTEHNQNLGADRANATRNYLIGKGVPEGRLLVTSRGEEGARGTGEDSWALDRRVDLVLRDRPVATETPLPPANPAQTNVNAAERTPGTQPPLPPANPPLKNVEQSPSGK